MYLFIFHQLLKFLTAGDESNSGLLSYRAMGSTDLECVEGLN